MPAARLLNGTCDFGRVLVHLDTDHQPHPPLESLTDPAIDSNVGIEFGGPPNGICFGHHGLFWTAMPDIRITVDRDLDSRESYPGVVRMTYGIDPVAQTPISQILSKSGSRVGPHPPEVRHELTDGGLTPGSFLSWETELAEYERG